MSTKPSLLWLPALPASLLVLAAAYYIRNETIRQAIDARTPLAHEYLGRFVRGAVEEEAAPKPPKDTAPSSLEAMNSIPVSAETPAKPKAPTAFSLQDLARDRSLWPKKVALKKATTFPAVVNGVVVGNLVAPVGTEANLVAIKDGKVGLEYQGGGGWFPVDDTDLARRVPMR